MFLTPEELADLTDYEPNSWTAQIRWLDRHKYPFELSAMGRPKVLRAYVENRLGLSSKTEKRTAPDFSSWAKA